MRLFILVLSIFCFPLEAASVKNQIPCPNCKLEVCEWEIRAEKIDSTIYITWDKSVISHHTEKPYASSLHCNVDRSFSSQTKGSIKVWFEGEKTPCEISENSDPSVCGISFLFYPHGESKFPSGFKIKSPEGKALAKVEHLSTLNLQCGMLEKEGFTAKPWNAKVGWSKTTAGDGTYANHIH